MNSTFMKEKPVGPLLASMALPMVFSMLVNSLYNIVDSFFVAQISEQAMTALSLVYPVQNMINAVAIGFGIGINARVSYHLGAGDKKMADTAATHGFFLSVIHGILMTVISIAVMPVFLQMYTQDETVIRMGLEYSTIVFLFSTVIAISLFFEKLFQAVGRMKVSMLALLVGCISNIILDPFLIWGIGFFPKLGIRGAALATGIGQVLTIAVYMVFYILKPIPVRVTPKALKTSKVTDLSLYAIGVPAILNLALLRTAYGTFHNYPGNHCRWLQSTEDHQRRLSCFCCIRYHFRCHGRPWKRHAVPCNFPFPLCGRYHAHRISSVPFYGS